MPSKVIVSTFGLLGMLLEPSHHEEAERTTWKRPQLQLRSQLDPASTARHGNEGASG